MTAQRLVRGSKARIIIGVCLVLLTVGAIFHHETTVSQLENTKKSYDICTQQQESLSIQLQVIVDYKTRLEKTLQDVQIENKLTRTELEARVNDEKLRRDKTSIEANLRFTSLQQNYKLLQTKHEDLKIKSDKIQQQYAEDTEKLQAKLKELEEQVKQSKKDKETALEHLESEYMRLQVDKERLEENIRGKNNDHTDWESQINHLQKENNQLQREIAVLKHGSNVFDKSSKHDNVFDKPADENTVKDDVLVTVKNFAKQVELSSNVYQIQDQENVPLVAANPETATENTQQIDAPKLNAHADFNALNINNLENNVLQKPANQSKSTVKTNSDFHNYLVGAQPLILPTVTPSTKKNQAFKQLDNDYSRNVLRPPSTINKKVKLPPGVVPIPKEEIQKNEEQKNEKTEDKNIPDEINLALPNRYRNNIIESQMANEIIKEAKVEPKPINTNILQGEPEVNIGGDLNNQDNNAMEVIDQPKNPAQDDPLNLMDVNNQNMDPSEVKDERIDSVLKDPVVNLIEHKRIKKQHIDALRFGDRQNEAVVRAPVGAALYEGEADYDKDGHKEDLQIEEQEPEGEEDDDGDDYDGHLAARQKDPAVRN